MKLRTWLVGNFGLAFLILAGPLFGQQNQNEVEIINQDGENVKTRVIAVQNVDNGDEAGITVKNEDGKITIIEADGTKREIDVSGAQSIIVNQSVKSIMKDGEKETQTFGKAIIIGPDGERQEIELGGPIEGQWNLDADQLGLRGRLPGMLRLQRNDVSKYMIGVNCTPVADAIRAQLKLESGVGLVVDHVGTDTPAAAAGLELHDILMFADDKQLTEISDLVAAVQNAGKENNKMSLTVIREGKEVGIDVSPVERPESEQMPIPGYLKVFPQLKGDQFDLQMRQLGPGVIIGQDMTRENLNEVQEKMAKQLEELQAEMQRMQKMMRDQQDKNK